MHTTYKSDNIPPIQVEIAPPKVCGHGRYFACSAVDL